MTRYIALLGIALSTAFFHATDASAQLSGQRSLGQSVAQQPAATRNAAASSRTTGTASRTTTNSAGNRPATESRPSLVNENARFIRGNRDASDFVGAAGREVQQFVGRLEAGVEAEEIRSAVDDLDIQTGPDANRMAQPVMPPRVRMYAPRLRVAFDYPPTGDIEVNSRLTHHLEAVLPAESSSRIEVLVAGDAAILRGAVASERDRKLAALLLQFEPGIARVENQLQVQPDEPPQPAPKAKKKAKVSSPNQSPRREESSAG
jgi:osmotically-inducible protein OsmY